MQKTSLTTGFFVYRLIFIFKVEIIEQIINDRILLILFGCFFLSMILLYWIEKPKRKPKKSSKSSEKPVIWFKIKNKGK